MKVIRNIALLLRPSMLDDLGLVPALRVAGAGNGAADGDTDPGATRPTTWMKPAGRDEDVRVPGGAGSAAQRGEARRGAPGGYTA